MKAYKIYEFHWFFVRSFFFFFMFFSLFTLVYVELMFYFFVSYLLVILLVSFCGSYPPPSAIFSILFNIRMVGSVRLLVQQFYLWNISSIKWFWMSERVCVYGCVSSDTHGPRVNGMRDLCTIIIIRYGMNVYKIYIFPPIAYKA